MAPRSEGISAEISNEPFPNSRYLRPERARLNVVQREITLGWNTRVGWRDTALFTQHHHLAHGADLAELTDQKVVAVSIAVHLGLRDNGKRTHQKPRKKNPPRKPHASYKPVASFRPLRPRNNSIHPLINNLSPNKVPRAQVPDTGNCCQINMPSTKDSTALPNIQPQP